ncbi:hypothetical protein E4U15_005933 [Claviceps sp. LM218 group G6]|nr:hypothetical protein E4U15_005933 [Claviceps sp. LM218 group G6]
MNNNSEFPGCSTNGKSDQFAVLGVGSTCLHRIPVASLYSDRIPVPYPAAVSPSGFPARPVSDPPDIPQSRAVLLEIPRIQALLQVQPAYGLPISFNARGLRHRLKLPRLSLVFAAFVAQVAALWIRTLTKSASQANNLPQSPNSVIVDNHQNIWDAVVHLPPF